MRTTLSLDEDVSTRLKAEVRRSGKPFKQVVNECLRLALATRRPARSVEPPFELRPRDLGALRPGLSLVDAFLAALALENGATLVTTDRDFSRFPKVRLSDPTTA